MSEHRRPFDARIAQALVDLTAIIAPMYPTATFEVFWRDDPDGARLRIEVDVEESEEVMDLIVDKLYEIQVEQYLPVYVIPVPPRTRTAEVAGERTTLPAQASTAS